MWAHRNIWPLPQPYLLVRDCHKRDDRSQVTTGSQESLLGCPLGLLWQQQQISPGKFAPDVDFFGYLIPAYTSGEVSTYGRISLLLLGRLLSGEFLTAVGASQLQQQCSCASVADRGNAPGVLARGFLSRGK